MSEQAFLREFRLFRGCISKKTYMSEESALKSAMKKGNNPNQVAMRAYRCPNCKQFHTAKVKPQALR